MKRPYLLGFIRNCTDLDLPCEPPFPTELTTVGAYSVIWCKSPREMFTTKQDFLAAMLQWLEQVQDLQLTVLPIQSGVGVSDEVHLVELLRTYEQELELCFDKVEGCSEYCLTISPKNQEFTPLTYSALREDVQSGKEYLERLRVRHQLLDREVVQAREVVSQFCIRLTPWVKDYWSEIPPTRGAEINLGFLVPNASKHEFINELKTLLDEVDFADEWTGPWPPFHFSSFSLKLESFLIRESLNWG
ncbi:gas vesicle protein L [Candidatus Desulfosporosinus infrequens]|uniref:Gas vesicle protein L n=1 Tax=Candidatus Desulfosporosinus infrequens TaxID=2043169 RepID=A0A2U3KXZ6_9FIRM|nr:gas vesicle protein L [Candidatus Desulfosporosinus infrequens]